MRARGDDRKRNKESTAFDITDRPAQNVGRKRWVSTAMYAMSCVLVLAGSYQQLMSRDGMQHPERTCCLHWPELDHAYTAGQRPLASGCVSTLGESACHPGLPLVASRCWNWLLLLRRSMMETG